MSISKRSVRVHQVPSDINPKVEHAFLREMRACTESERPRFVLDCSRVRHMDPSTISLLVCSLEEAMKCNGDVRLASLHPQAVTALSLAGVSRLFEVFDTVESAIQSYHRRAASLAPFMVAGNAANLAAGQAA